MILNAQNERQIRINEFLYVVVYLNTISVLFEKNSCKVGYVIDDRRIRPPAELLNSDGKVPVVDCDHWCDVVSAMEKGIDDRVHGGNDGKQWLLPEQFVD